jgi:translation initiation factor 2 gamma subunit (eIF-2gamma)
MQTLQDAIDNEAKQKAAHDAKLAVLAEAIAKKESTIASAAGGAVVRADDLLKLETAARTAEAGVAISGSILAGATRLRHQAEIDLWHEEAATLTGAEDQAITARIASPQTDSACC